MADIVFAFDPALDHPIPGPDAVPPAVADTLARAPLETLEAAVAIARREKSAALVLCGRVLDPTRASPAQAALLRRLILDLAADGCTTVWMADERSVCADVSLMLGEPRGLVFATPLEPLHLETRGIAIEIVAASGLAVAAGAGSSATAATTIPGTLTAHGSPALIRRRIVVGWDSAHWTSERWDTAGRGGEQHATGRRGNGRHDAGERDDGTDPAALFRPLSGWSHPGTFCVWGSRRLQPLPPGVLHLPPLQARSAHETAAGGCCTLALVEPAVDHGLPGTPGHHPAPLHADVHPDRRHWRERPTHLVAWRTLTVASTAGGDEELATTIWSALEGLPADGHAAVEIIRCAVECGTSVARRVRVAEISAETLARVRQLYDPRTVRGWCHELAADSSESLAPLGHGRSGGRPGSTTSFSTALADIVLTLEQQPLPSMPADMAREAAWLALELIESS